MTSAVVVVGGGGGGGGGGSVAPPVAVQSPNRSDAVRARPVMTFAHCQASTFGSSSSRCSSLNKKVTSPKKIVKAPARSSSKSVVATTTQTLQDFTLDSSSCRRPSCSVETRDDIHPVLSKPSNQVDNGPSSAPAVDSGADEVDLAGPSPLSVPLCSPPPPSPSPHSSSALCDKDNSLCVVCDNIYNESTNSPMSMATSDDPAGCGPRLSDASVTCPVNTEDDLLDDFFKFVSNENIFKVTVHKTAQGLGLSVTGGVAPSIPVVDNCSWPGLIRIKKIFVHGAAWQTEKLAVGDVLLAVNGVPLTGSTNYEALEILRCSARESEITVCRIPSEITDKMGIHPPESPTSVSSSSHTTNWLSPFLPLTTLGEFEISMTKVNGSLGFTLRKEDESVLGHYVRSLVKEPAISDSRIRAGDKIISVNGFDMSSMSHAEAVTFLRRCPETVTIRLFRDSAVTPISPLSPTEPEVSINKPRPLLRQEAQDLLHDLAVRKQGGSRGGSPAPLSGSPCSPRRRRLTKTPSPDLSCVVRDRYGSTSSLKENIFVPLNSSSPPMSPLPEMDMERDTSSNGLDLTDLNSESFHTPNGASMRITRPHFLDLSNSLVKKQRFMFTPPHDHPPSGFEEIRQSGDGRPEPVDANELDISEYLTPNNKKNSSTSSLLDEWSRHSLGGSHCNTSQKDNDDDDVGEECANESLEDIMDDEFVSFHSSTTTLERYAPQGISDRDLNDRFSVSSATGDVRGKEGLVKWKGIVLTPDEEYEQDAHLGLIQTIELNKGWNSRLGFSVGLSAEGQLVISAIYDNSVAAKDGRLQVDDHVLRVNGEKLEGCSKEYVIDILRKTRGPVAITVRKPV